MLFSSMTFLFIFLPAVAAVYFLAPKRFKNDVLLVASFLFYAFGEPWYVFLMIASVFVNYVGARLIESTRFKKTVLFLTVAANLGTLGYFKYFNFVVENVNAVFGARLGPVYIVLPVGISFYTFQALSYVIDVYRGQVAAQKDAYRLALYIMLFPQLIAGPIVKYHDIAGQIDDRAEDIDDVYYGALRFIGGLAKKMLIADTLGMLADEVFGGDLRYVSTPVAWAGAIAYMFQIYYDFSGYSDMAIGLCRMFGFKIPENFDHPYVSRSITEFWRRWHISLSTWFKEYLYIPLGGNRVSKPRTAFNLMFVFLMTGLWHGAGWTFVLWGAFHGALIVCEKLAGLDTAKRGRARDFFMRVYTLAAVLAGWVLFRAESLPAAVDYFKKMLGLIPDEYAALDFVYYVDGEEALAFAFAAVLSAPVAKDFFTAQNKHPVLARAVALALFLLSVTVIGAGTFNPFIYFRF